MTTDTPHPTLSPPHSPPSLLHRRVCTLDNFTGTVRYHGPVPHSAATAWLGIEWDDPTRGKHSGTHDGISYFTPSVPGSATLVRADSNKLLFARSLSDAVREKYLGVQPQDGTIVLGSGDGVMVETVGWAKAAGKVGDASRLAIVGLDGARVGYGDPSDPVQLTAVEDLDLSRNLLATIEDVATIARACPRLKSLRLAHNRLQPSNGSIPASVLAGAFTGLAGLSLLGTRMPWADIELIAIAMPSLAQIHFGSNGLASFDSAATPRPPASPPPHVTGFPSLHTLNLDQNSFTSWSEIARLSRLPQLRTLILSNNALTSISPPATPSDFAHLTSLNISSNAISSWECIHALNSFPSLIELRARSNPIISNMSPPDAAIDLIARLGNLTTLDGSTITARYRLDAELLYLSRCARAVPSVDPSHHPRFAALVAIHGPPPTSDAPDALPPGRIEASLVDMAIVGGGRRVRKKLPRTMTVRALRAIVGRLFGGRKVATMAVAPPLDEEKGPQEAVLLDDDIKELGYYDVQNGWEVCVDFE
ncbi:hypothetical protein BDK51DRAFT_15975 [Blyttiomyces helicus]|uniref:CAP-Gly domain-containing protein n=1 Tax=Blyttiomyces helicus TaxID=388810 RepID=A0A4P9W7U5_9FUNG|nr:hypothetical protein BDK51DRAFT_15975 [Blyttiomyces helicus]|eukprot:RKO87465.1 hypothetical protein BDK51DRAFT_15975 [Blyttiomyces helicus]